MTEARAAYDLLQKRTQTEVCAQGHRLTLASTGEAPGAVALRCPTCEAFVTDTRPLHNPSLKERYRVGMTLENAGFTLIEAQSLAKLLNNEVRRTENRPEGPSGATVAMLDRLNGELHYMRNNQEQERGMVVSQPGTRQAAVYSGEELRILKQQIAPQVSDGEFELFIATAIRRGLDPFAHQIHATVRSTYNPETRQRENKMVMITGIDGYRAIASKAKYGKYAGADDTEFGPMVDDPLVETGRRPEWAKATVYMIVQGQRVAFSATVWWEERVQVRRGQGENSRKVIGYTGQWPNQPRTMLGKCAEAAALRKAAPEEMAGVEFADAQPDYIEEPFIEGEAREVPADVNPQTGEIVGNVNPLSAQQRYEQAKARAVAVDMEFRPDTSPDADAEPAQAAMLADDLPAVSLITPPQVRQIRAAREAAAGWTQARLQTYAEGTYGRDMLHLTEEEAGEVLVWLKGQPQKPAAEKEQEAVF